MAQKQRKKRGWLRTALFFLFFPLLVWFVALLIWFYWYDLARMFSGAEEKSKAGAKIESQQERREKAAPATPSPPQEKLLDEDRKKLEDILKRRQ